MSFLIPSRTSRPSDDPIFALNAEAKKRAGAGEAIINATVGALMNDEGHIATLPSVVAALAETSPEIGAAYAPIVGSADFRKGVVLDLFGDRPEAAWATAIATPGGTGALRHAIANFLEPGQKVLTTSYYWGPYKTLAEESDRAMATFRMFDEQGGLDRADFKRALHAMLETQGRALIFLNSPCHNPTGFSFSPEEWRAVREIVVEESQHGPITVCLDIAYARFGDPQAFKAMMDEMLQVVPKAMLLFAWSASKTFLQYGLRVGALVLVHSDTDERKRGESALGYSCRGTWSNVNAGGMNALGRLLLDESRAAKVEAERAQMVALLQGRVAAWNALAAPAGLRYPRYAGGFFTTVLTGDAFKKAERLKEKGIFVVPQEGALRVALCSVAERDVPRLVAELAAVV